MSLRNPNVTPRNRFFRRDWTPRFSATLTASKRKSHAGETVQGHGQGRPRAAGARRNGATHSPPRWIESPSARFEAARSTRSSPRWRCGDCCPAPILRTRCRCPTCTASRNPANGEKSPKERAVQSRQPVPLRRRNHHCQQAQSSPCAARGLLRKEKNEENGREARERENGLFLPVSPQRIPSPPWEDGDTQRERGKSEPKGGRTALASFRGRRQRRCRD